MTPTAEEILELFREGLTQDSTLDKAFDALIAATDSRAVGMWRLRGDHLEVLGFRAHPDMPGEVASEFAAATERVGLDQTHLAIVHSVVNNTPTVAMSTGVDGPLRGSANWLVRFQASHSLVMPLRRNGEVFAVIAIAAARELTPDGPEGALTRQLAEGLAPLLAPSAE